MNLERQKKKKFFYAKLEKQANNVIDIFLLEIIFSYEDKANCTVTVIFSHALSRIHISFVMAKNETDKKRLIVLHNISVEKDVETFNQLA